MSDVSARSSHCASQQPSILVTLSCRSVATWASTIRRSAGTSARLRAGREMCLLPSAERLLPDSMITSLRQVVQPVGDLLSCCLGGVVQRTGGGTSLCPCLLYTSDAADDLL